MTVVFQFSFQFYILFLMTERKIVNYTEMILLFCRRKRNRTQINEDFLWSARII